VIQEFPSQGTLFKVDLSASRPSLAKTLSIHSRH